MQSKNNAPNKAQRDWREEVRALGSVLSGEPAVIHHPVGTTGKHNKVHIGHWWVIPLTDDEHTFLHRDRILFETHALFGMPYAGRDRWTCEKVLFERVIQALGAESLPPGVLEAIRSYRR